MSTQTPLVPITSEQPAAIAACNNAMLGYVQRKSNVVTELQAALASDPDCAFANAALGLMLHGGRNAAFNAKTVACHAKAEENRGNATPHEAAYIDALGAATKGNLNDYVKHLDHALTLQPTDIFGIALVQSELFWIGQLERSLEITDRVLPHWNENVPAYADFLGCRAFDLEEANRFDEAEAVGRASVDLDPASVWATHAVAHVLLMQGRSKEGVEWISPQEKHWDDCNQIKFHVWWHKCLFYIETGQHDAALDTYDKSVRNLDNELLKAMPDLYIDLQNGASLLWRLEHLGVDVGNRWEEMAEVVLPRLGDTSNPFTSAHFAMILAAVGSFDKCEELIANMEEFAGTQKHHTLAGRYAAAGVPAAKAALLHRQGQHDRVVEALMPARKELWQMGGSHAQQDLFFQLLTDSAAKDGRISDVATLLGEIEAIGFVEPAKRVGYHAAAALA